MNYDDIEPYSSDRDADDGNPETTDLDEALRVVDVRMEDLEVRMEDLARKLRFLDEQRQVLLNARNIAWIVLQDSPEAS